MASITVHCPRCNSDHVYRHGKTPVGHVRYRCPVKNQHKHDEAEALYREIEQNSDQVVGCIDQLLQEVTQPER